MILYHGTVLTVDVSDEDFKKYATGDPMFWEDGMSYKYHASIPPSAIINVEKLHLKASK